MGDLGECAAASSVLYRLRKCQCGPVVKADGGEGRQAAQTGTGTPLPRPIRRAVRVATLGTDDRPFVAILQRMVPATVFRLRPTEA
jgi:hypothetical protein